MQSQTEKQRNKKGLRERADLQEGMWVPRGYLFALLPFPSMAPLTFSVDSLSIYTYLCICFHIPILYAHHESPWARQTEKLRHLSTWIISCTIHWNIMREQADAQSWQRYCRFATVTVDWWHLISSTWPIRSDQIISLSRGLCFLHYLCQDGVPACYGFPFPIWYPVSFITRHHTQTRSIGSCVNQQKMGSCRYYNYMFFLFSFSFGILCQLWFFLLK